MVTVNALSLKTLLFAVMQISGKGKCLKAVSGHMRSYNEK